MVSDDRLVSQIPVHLGLCGIIQYVDVVGAVCGVIRISCVKQNKGGKNDPTCVSECRPSIRR